MERKRKSEGQDANSSTKRTAWSNLIDWSHDEVITWLKREKFEEFEPSFQVREITGKRLLELGEDLFGEIDEFGIISDESKERLTAALEKLKGESTNASNLPNNEDRIERKVFQDSIHGSIDFHPLLPIIMDTPQFQRLRNLKQLGCVHLVYPAAAHHRFEHSLGVSYLAGTLLRKLKKNQPELTIDEKDILCVEIAGLCHDLGHGPFSHSFEGRLIPILDPDSNWRHEDGSVMMFQHLVDNNVSVQKALKKYDFTSDDIRFIKEQIQGPHGPAPSARPKQKAFLYDVVANKRNGIDVDKWDYFARDCHYLGIRNAFDHMRLMNFVRVIEVQGEPQICTRDKEAETLYDMFHTRRSLQKRVYQHRVVQAIDIMLCEALTKANDHIKIYNSKGEARKITECRDDPDAYTNLTDHIFYEILYSRDEALQEAREILLKIQRRDLYKSIGETRPQSSSEKNPFKLEIEKKDLPEYAASIATCLTEENLQGSPPLAPDDIILNLVRLDYGMGHKNPIENVRFYSKHNPDTPIRQRKDQVSTMLPETFCEQILVAYCKQTDPERVEVAENAFREWCETRHLQPIKSGNRLNMTQN